jgi:uridine kinase
VSSNKVKLVRYFGYLYLEAEVSTALKILKAFREKRGSREDIEDSIRILENFDAYYELMRKKYKEFIAPRKNEADMLSGVVTVDKIKLEHDGRRLATVVFDKRVRPEEVADIIKELNLELIES